MPTFLVPLKVVVVLLGVLPPQASPRTAPNAATANTLVNRPTASPPHAAGGAVLPGTLPCHRVGDSARSYSKFLHHRAHRSWEIHPRRPASRVHRGHQQARYA